MNSELLKVVKFGGSSLASAEQFEKVGSIIRAESSRRFVVPSAPGKRFSDDIKVTDMLYGCYALAEEGKDFKKELAAIKARYEEIRHSDELIEILKDGAARADAIAQKTMQRVKDNFGLGLGK